MGSEGSEGSDIITAELIRQLNNNSGLIAKVLEKQEIAEGRRKHDTKAIKNIGDKVDELNDIMAAVPPEVHVGHHHFIDELHEEVVARKDRQRNRADFWRGARDKMMEQGLVKASGLVIVGLIGFFWKDALEFIQNFYISMIMK